MKISEMGNIVILFMDDYNVIKHKVVFKSLPDINSLLSILNEVKMFLPNDLVISMIDVNEYIAILGDEEMDDIGVIN